MCKLLKLLAAVFLLSCSFFPSAEAAVPAGIVITSPFGYRTDPVYGAQSFHAGIDIAADYGAGIPAVFSGIVVTSCEYGEYGNVIVIQHDDASYTLYGHCSRLIAQLGQHVEQGEIIALVGSTGKSTGPHLHLGYYKNGQWLDPLTLWD